MDKIVSLLVRLMVFLSGFAKWGAKLGIGGYEEYRPGKKLKLLLVGYNGARNTGADARVVAIVDQLREQFGQERVHITVMTLNRQLLEGYFPPDVEGSLGEKFVEYQKKLDDMGLFLKAYIEEGLEAWQEMQYS